MLERLLASGSRTEALVVATMLAGKFGNMRTILSLSDRRLRRELAAWPWAGERLLMLRDVVDYCDRELLTLDPKIGIEQLSAFVQRRLGSEPVEVFYAFYFSGGALLWDGELARGNGGRVNINIADIVHRTIDLSATLVVLAHNHPSGDATPSAADVTTTRAINRALGTIGSRVYDHLIVTGHEVISLRAQQLFVD